MGVEAPGWQGARSEAYLRYASDEATKPIGMHRRADGNVISTRALRVAAKGKPVSADTQRMAEAYAEYYAVAPSALVPGASCHDVHRAVSQGFSDRGYHLGHVTGHSIGMTMIEFPKIGEGVEFELAENMVFSMHPHAIAANGEDCLYMQDTWLVTASGGVALASLPMEIFVAG